jgi:drug/metabolite transporter (DMT)-like permease
MLFAYALLFSLAYIELTTGTGALILFAAVQLTMISISLLKGNRPSPKVWMGVALAFGGLVYLLLPGITAPPLISAAMMAGAGMAWGIYSILGKKAHNPSVATARNFLYTLPFIGLLITISSIGNPTNEGIILAVISGSITSGLGYLLWYKVLKHITTITAAIVQLFVPIIAAIGGVLFISEGVSTRLIIASLLILSGIWLTIKAGQKTSD